jgi:hypothetical protein
VPAIVGWAAAAVLLLSPQTRRVGAGLTAGVTLVWLSAYLSNIGAVVSGSEHAGRGFDLRMAGIVLALLGTIVAVRAEVRAGGGPSSSRGAPLWAMLVGLVGIAWGIGDAMNWHQVRVHATTTGYTFKSTGTATIIHSYGSLLHLHGWMLSGSVLITVLAVLIPVLAAVWRPTGFGVAAIIGAALALVALPLSEVVYLRRPLTAASLDVTPAQVHQGGYVMSQHGLPGLWIAIIAAAVLVLLAAGLGFQVGSERHR